MNRARLLNAACLSAGQEAALREEFAIRFKEAEKLRAELARHCRCRRLAVRCSVYGTGFGEPHWTCRRCGLWL